MNLYQLKIFMQCEMRFWNIRILNGELKIMNKLKIYLSLLIAAFAFSTIFGQIQPEKIKVACVGNSVTFGYGIKNREINSYPAQLQKMLGGNYKVGNFGKSGATLLTKGHRPYIQQSEFQEALKFNPQIVVIHLGLNDTDPRDWPNYRDNFIKNYSALIDTFRNLPTNPQIWICKMTPIFSGHSRFKSGTRDWFWQIQEKIEVVAKGKTTKLIDLHTPLYSRPDLFADNLHPNFVGAKIIARTIYSEITGDFGGLKMPNVFSDNMVLQRGIPIPVFGTANRGKQVIIELDSTIKIVDADEHGNWNIDFPAKSIGEPFYLKVTNTDTTFFFQNIVMGDVWLCSGQSNMAFQFKQSARAKTEVPIANNSYIRFLNMKTAVWPKNESWPEADLQRINRLNYFEGKWEVCSPETAAGFSAVAYYFGQKLQKELDIPIGLIMNAVGGSPTEAWIDRKTLEFNPQLVDVFANWKKNDFVQDWCRERATINIKNASNPLQRHPFQPAYLFEAGILPIKNVSVKGVIWYQGESNAHNIEFHEKIFPTLVESWRNVWGEDLPFYFVQLSSINRPSWGHFRDSQRRLAEQISNCEMAVSSDLGHPTNVHPKQKKDVGERLALIALSNLYNENVQWQGPKVKQIAFNKNKVVVEYTFVESLKTNDGNPLRGFEVAGENEMFYPAQTKLNGNTIELWSDEVPNPKHVRYGWSAYTDANLINEAGLPASTYTTEFETKNEVIK